MGPCAAARGSRDAVDAARHLARELGGRAVSAVIEDEDVRHGGLPSVRVPTDCPQHEF
jgi:hypothetical protein